MWQSALFEFKSSAFAIEPDEDQYTNPSIFGKALSQWLSVQLRAKGIPAGEVIPEDFGWCILITAKPYALFVVCASAEEEPNHWKVFAFCEGGFISRILGKDQDSQLVASLFENLKLILQSASFIEELNEGMT